MALTDVVIYTEDFGAGTATPTGWTLDSGYWTIESSGGKVPPVGYSICFFEDTGFTFVYGYAETGDIDCSAYENIRLSFYSESGLTGGELKHDYSIDGGDNWINLFQAVPPSDGTLTYTLPLADNLSTVRFRWGALDNSGFGGDYYIDDLEMLGDEIEMLIIQEPDNYTPTYNPVVSVVSGVNNTSENYKYLADIYFDGSVLTDYRLEVDARPSGFGVFNFRDVTKDFQTHDLEILADDDEGFKNNPNSYKSFTPVYGESHGTNPVVYANLATGTTINTFNGALSHNDFAEWYSSGYVLTVDQKKFLTTSVMAARSTHFGSERDRYIGTDENAWVYFMVDTDNIADNMIITTWDGSSESSYILDNASHASVTSSRDNRFLRVPVGTRNLNKIPNSALSLGSKPIIDSTITEYRVSIRNAGGTKTSEQFTFILKEHCTPYEKYRLHFLNELGGFDSFTFSGRHDETINIQRGDYRRPSGRLDSAGAWTQSKGERNREVYSSIYNSKIVLNSDWIDTDQAQWLVGLITSPVVYWDNNDTLIPIIINTESVRLGRDENGELSLLTLEIELNNNNKRQVY